MLSSKRSASASRYREALRNAGRRIGSTFKRIEQVLRKPPPRRACAGRGSLLR
jgi:hypothetical protein